MNKKAVCVKCGGNLSRVVEEQRYPWLLRKSTIFFLSLFGMGGDLALQRGHVDGLLQDLCEACRQKNLNQE